MIAPDFRVTENIQVMKPAKTFVVYNYGDNMYKGMEADLQSVEATHNSLTQVVSHKTDAVQMNKFKDLYLQNYRNFSCFHKYLTFGKLKTNIDMKFTWYCSYTKTKKDSPMPLIEMYSSLYNFAVANMRQACYMSLEGDGTKNAGQFFQQSAWVFEHLLTVVT